MVILSAVVGTRDHAALSIWLNGGVPAARWNVGSSDVPQRLEDRGLQAWNIDIMKHSMPMLPISVTATIKIMCKAVSASSPQSRHNYFLSHKALIPKFTDGNIKFNWAQGAGITWKAEKEENISALWCGENRNICLEPGLGMRVKLVKMAFSSGTFIPSTVSKFFVYDPRLGPTEVRS